MNTIRAIGTEADYEAALARAGALMNPNFGQSEGEELDVLADLIEQYEECHIPIGYPTAVGALRFRMDRRK